jgi:hypothetical protein
MFQTLRRFHRDRRADVWAFLAVVLLFVALPLASLTVDVVRGLYVRTHLQVAADAACQAAANTVDAALFQATGLQQIDPGLARVHAGSVFYGTLADASVVGFAPSLSVGFAGPTTAVCQATASVAHIMPLTPPMTAVVDTTSQMRVVTGNP